MFEARFQTFDDDNQRAAIPARIAALRAELDAARTRRLRHPARRPAAERICAAVRRAAGLADRLHRLGRRRHRADASAPRCSSTAATRVQAAKQVDTSLFTIEHLVDPPPENWLEQNLQGRRRSATIRGCTPPTAPSGCSAPAPTRRRDAGRGRRQSARCGVDRPPAPPLGAVTLHDLHFSGESGSRQARRIQAETRQACAPTRWWCRTRTPSPGPSTSAAPTSRIRRCRLPLRSCRAKGRPALFIDGAKLDNSVRHALEEIADAAEPDDLVRDLAATGKGKAVRLDSASAADALARLVSDAGGKALRGTDPVGAAEGGQERSRDRGRARGAPARRRGAGAVPRLARPRGARRQS